MFYISVYTALYAWYMYRIIHVHLFVLSPFLQHQRKYRFEGTYLLISKQLVIFFEK